MSKLRYPCGYWCRAAPFRCKFPAGTQSSHHGAALRGPDWEINTILWKCVGEHTFIPQYLDCTYPLPTSTSRTVSAWNGESDANPHIFTFEKMISKSKSLMFKTFNICIYSWSTFHQYLLLLRKCAVDNRSIKSCFLYEKYSGIAVHQALHWYPPGYWMASLSRKAWRI